MEIQPIRRKRKGETKMNTDNKKTGIGHLCETDDFQQAASFLCLMHKNISSVFKIEKNADLFLFISHAVEKEIQRMEQEK
jgi:hypothetical protein